MYYCHIGFATGADSWKVSPVFRASTMFILLFLLLFKLQLIFPGSYGFGAGGAWKVRGNSKGMNLLAV